MKNKNWLSKLELPRGIATEEVAKEMPASSGY